MIMFALPSFCRVCLKYDKNLIDLAHIENEPNETLLSKLQLCVYEVEWDTFKPILCHPCIALLNIAYNFKKQCVQSASILKNYVELVKKSHNLESQYAQKTDDYATNSTSKGNYVILPNQKVVKIVVGGTQNPKPTCNNNNNNNNNNNTNNFQNVFVNLIPPATNIIPINTNTVRSNSQNNLMLNFNKTFQKLIPLSTNDEMPNRNESPISSPSSDDTTVENPNSNVHDLITNAKAEEMSVEIDPTSLFALEEDELSPKNELDSEKNDWDDVITKQKVLAKKPRLKITKITNDNDEKSDKNFTTDFGSHFLSGTNEKPIELQDFECESCQKTYPSMKSLKQHFKYSHLGKLPFRCDHCNLEYLTRSDYEQCLKNHVEFDQKTSISLEDFAKNTSIEDSAVELPSSQEEESAKSDNEEFTCNICRRVFNNSAGLMKHKIRQHQVTPRKKYFTKGQKNGRCDICKKDFSTLTYMRLHRRLHFRNENCYRLKIYGTSKSKYKNSLLNFDQQQQIKTKDNQKELKIRKLRVKRISDIQNSMNMKIDKQKNNNDVDIGKQKKKKEMKQQAKKNKKESKNKNGKVVNTTDPYVDEIEEFYSADSDRLVIEEDV